MLTTLPSLKIVLSVTNLFTVVLVDEVVGTLDGVPDWDAVGD
jgi:hypothetical protein